ncbi:MAG: hypothetical protein AB7K52_08775 [Phycisphaerales bacterium]
MICLPCRFARFALLVLALSGGFAAPQRALAWDAVGHRAITWLALDGLSADMPAWLRDKSNVHAIGWQASEPDRWRGLNSLVLKHENGPDHYLDIEDLARYGLTFETMPPLRMQYITAMAIARHEHPEGVDGTLKPHNPRFDPSGEQEWPGFLAHAMAEHFAKLAASFRNYRVLEKLAEPARAPQLDMAKANIAVEMGVLAHFVGDAAQPLHTTRYHHGWVTERSEPWKDNPDGFTTARSIHAFIDGGVIRQHGITYHTLKPGQKYEHTVDAGDPWPAILAHIRRSHEFVRRTYELERDGKFSQAEGRAFIEERLRDAASMLAAMYNAAWQAGAPSQKDIDDFVKYDGFTADQVP